MAAGIIRGTPIFDNSTMYIHARTQFTHIYAVDVIDEYEDTERIAVQFAEFAERNEFVKRVCERNGIVNASIARDFNDAQTMRMGLGLNHSITSNLDISGGINRTTSGDNTSTMLTAGLNWKF